MTAQHLSSSPALVGREHERAALTDAITRAEVGEPSITTIVGEPGIGKTTLADDFARIARRRGVTVVRGAADDIDRSTLSMWRGPMVALGIDVLDPELVGGDRRWEALGTIADALDAAAPIAVVLDDVHWADESSAWIVDHLVGAVTRGVAVVATTRAVEPRQRRSQPGLVLALQGLSVGEVAVLAGAASERGVDAAALQQRTGGNPLFVLELLATSPTAEGVPGAIDLALAHTLDRLSVDAQRSLTVLAAGGAHAPGAVIASAAGVSVAELRDHLDEGLELDVLVAPTLATVRFRHALFAETLISRLSAGERRALHASLAQAWRDNGSTEAASRAAAHALLAVPQMEPTEAATAALAAARAVLGVDPSSARGLLIDAIDVLEQYAPRERRLLAELLLDLGETLVTAVDWPGASEAFERAAALTVQVGDAQLYARAEAAAARQMSMFADEPVRRARLMNAAEGLGDGDHPLRVVLLGRLSVAELGRGDLWASARQHAIDAIAMARRIGDPELIATALTDRHLTAMDRDDVEARADAADELIQLGEMARRPDRVLVGLQWRYGAALAPGHLEAAKGVLDHTEVLAALMPSPEWTYGVLLRRALLTAIDGDREAALALIQEARPLGDRVLWPDESLGLEVGARTLVTRITGVFDPDLPALNAEFESLAQLPPNAFFGAHSAAAALACGDVDDARRMVDRLAARVCRAEPTGEAPSTILLIAALAGELGLTQHASALRRLCEPFRGYLTTESGFAVDQPADATLADLALLDGDAVGALGMIDACLELVRSMPSSTYEARCLWRRSNINRALRNAEAADRDLQQAVALARRIGAALPNEPSAAPPDQHSERASMVRSESTWLISSPHGRGVVAHSTGVEQLAKVLAAAPREVLAIDLIAAVGVPLANSLGPALDTAAKHAYRRRIAELNAEIDESDEFHDLERSARARVELEALMQELRRAVGLHGRDRPTASGAERARVNVARSIRRAIDAVRASNPGLGAHLDVSIRTGRSCCYAPEPLTRLEWDVQYG